MTNITIATFNINSIKARLPNLLAWLRENPIDILLLQELKCVDEAFPAMELEELGYNLAVHGQKTYNGVAICSKFPLDDVVRGLPEGDGDDHARYIEAVANIPGGVLRVASAYVPNGQDIASDKFPYKLRFFERLHLHWQDILKHNEMAVLGGDFNCAPLPIDTWSPATQDGTICYHPAERERLRGLMHLGLYDAFRVLHPDTKQYSWWDYRAGSYERGQGMRIDHLLLSGRAADHLSACHIDEWPRQQEKPSDHAPVIATLAF